MGRLGTEPSRGITVGGRRESVDLGPWKRAFVSERRSLVATSEALIIVGIGNNWNGVGTSQAWANTDLPPKP